MLNSEHLDSLCGQGFTVFESFYDEDTCERMLRHAKVLLQQHRALASRCEFEFDTGKGNDNSIYGVENVWADAGRFGEEPLIRATANDYILHIRQTLDRHPPPAEDQLYIRYLLECVQERGNYEIFKEGNVEYQSWLVKLTGLHPIPGKLNNTGGDWHRDSLFPGVKAILFLTDVGPDNSPLQIFPGSRYYIDDHPLASVDGINVIKREGKTKYSDALIRKNFPALMPSSLAVPRGSIALFDTSVVHRGKPIEGGERWALSNYLFRGLKDTHNLHWFKYNQWQNSYIDSS